MTWFRAHLRAVGGPAALLAVVVAVVTFVIVATPRLVDTTLSAELRERIDAMAPAVRDIRTDATGAIAADAEGAAPLSGLRDDLGAIRDELPAVLRERAGAPDFVLSLPEVPLQRTPDEPDGLPIRHLVLATLGASDALRIVEGVAPSPPAPPVEGVLRTVTMALSVESAREMHWGIGEVREGGYGAIQLVGTFEASDPGADVWDITPSIIKPRIFDDGNRAREVYGIGITDPGFFARAQGGIRIAAWFPVAAAGARTEEAPAMLTALRRLASSPFPLTVAPRSAPVSLYFRSGAEDAIAAALARSGANASVLALAAAGPIGTALVVFVVGVLQLGRRQRRVMGIARARGASARQLTGALFGVGAVIGVPGAVAGLLAAVLLVPGAPLGGSALLASALCAVAPAVALACLPRPVGHLGRTGSTTRTRAIRLLVEVTALLAAGAALLVVAQRDGSASADRGPDPILTATPIVLAIAVGLLLLRVSEFVLAGLARRGARSPGLVASTGPRRAARDRGSGVAIVLALVVAVAVAAFSVILLDSIILGVDQAAAAAAADGSPAAVAPDSPLLRGLATALSASVALSGVLVAIALAVTTLADRASRERLVAGLRLAGMSRTQWRGLTWWEAVPTALTGVLGGLVLGVLLSGIAGAVDLAAFTGQDEQPLVVIDPLAVAAIAVGFLIVAIGVRMPLVARAGRARPAVVFRAIEEGD